METADYIPLVAAGAEGLVVYQETYDREAYRELHTAGPKRISTGASTPPSVPTRLDSDGSGSAFSSVSPTGVARPRHWQPISSISSASAGHPELTVSMPRLRPAAGGFQPRFPFGDRDFTQLLCALRLTFPHVGIVLSTREPLLSATRSPRSASP